MVMLWFEKGPSRGRSPWMRKMMKNVTSPIDSVSFTTWRCLILLVASLSLRALLFCLDIFSTKQQHQQSKLLSKPMSRWLCKYADNITMALEIEKLMMETTFMRIRTEGNYTQGPSYKQKTCIKLKWQQKVRLLKTDLLLNMGDFNCHVNSPEAQPHTASTCWGCNLIVEPFCVSRGDPSTL